jgi:hypothetical protein
LSDLNKKDRNKRHSSPFINVVKGVFFVVRVTLVPVSYLSVPSTVHSYRVPGKFIRRLKSLFVEYEKFIRLVRIKQKFICIAYLYSKCTDCRINIFICLKFTVPNIFILTKKHFSNFEIWFIFNESNNYLNCHLLFNFVEIWFAL